MMYSKKRRIVTFVLLTALCGLLLSGTTGKISGTVVDADSGEPLLEANVRLYDQAGNYLQIGAATDWDGNFFMIGVQPGTYNVKFTYVGYDSLMMTGVHVSSDRTTDLNVEMTSGVEVMQAVEVVATREKIEKDLAATKQYASSEEMDKMPVESVDDVLETKVGVINHNGQLHYRGSRGNEVATYVDGMPVNDPTYGNSSLDVSTSAVAEVSVETGSFQAEYGGGMSAIVNIVTKEGDPNKTAGSILFRTDDFHVDAINKFSNGSNRLEFSLSGPEPITNSLLPLIGIKMPRDKKISYFLAVNGENTDTRLKYNYRYDFDDHIYTTDGLNSNNNIDYGWYGFFPEKRQNAYSINLKIKQRITPNIKYSLSYTNNIQRSRIWNWIYLYSPVSAQVYEKQVHSIALNFTHTLSPSTFYEVRAGFLHDNTNQTPNGYEPGDFAVDSVSYWNILDDWRDINNDGVANVRQQWVDNNGNGMWDYGEAYWPTVILADTIDTDPLTIDTLAVDSLPPQIGEEPWVDWNDNGVFEYRKTNYNNANYSLDEQEPYQDGEPFRDGYTVYFDELGQQHSVGYYEGFVDDTLWVDIDGDGNKDWGEFVFGTYYTNDEILLEEATWVDANGDGDVDQDEYIDVNRDGAYTVRDNYAWGNSPDFNDLNGNGLYDVGEPGEPFLDLNDNGYWDPPNLECDPWEPYIDLNDNEGWDGIDGFYERGFDRWAVWSDRTTTKYILKGDLTSQVNNNNQVKTGFEFQLMNIEMNQIQYPEAYYDGSIDGMPWQQHGIFRSFYERSPKSLAFYLQDKMEYGGLIANAGIRVESFIQAGEVLEDSLEDAIVDVIGTEIGYDLVKSRTKVSPRLGMSYPVSDKAKLFFSYGHFYQMPAYDNMYQTPNQGGNAIRLIGNPNMDFQKTVSYEIGVAYAITELMTVNLSGYYRDVYDLLNTTTMRIGPITQSIYENVDYGRSRGVEVTFEKAYRDFWQVNANYQYAFAYGKSSSDRSGYDAIVDQTAIPLRDLPLDWDRRHVLQINVDLRAMEDDHPVLFGYQLPDNWGLNVLFTYESGKPYTPSAQNPHWDVKPGEKAWERTNALRMPSRYNVNLRFQKYFKFFGLQEMFFVDVDNLTNRRNIETVYSDTGEPDDPNVTDGVGDALDYYSNPTHWSSPTNIKVGLQLSFD